MATSGSTRVTCVASKHVAVVADLKLQEERHPVCTGTLGRVAQASLKRVTAPRRPFAT